MLSTALSQLFERARTRFGLEVEILDAELQRVYPDAGSDLGRLIAESPSVRSALLDALAEAARQLNLGGITIGHAAFSPDCRTAEALVSQAVRDAEPVAV
jgi:hypothetical protein